MLITRHSDTYHPRVYRALLATDGARWRISFYWLDPTPECEVMDTLAFSDFLIDSDRVDYCHRKDMDNKHTLLLDRSCASRRTELPLANQLEPVLVSVLTLVVHNRTAQSDCNTLLETARFFRGARESDRFTHTVEARIDTSGDTGGTGEVLDVSQSILNQLPFGRTYSTQSDEQGTVIWRLSKTCLPTQRVQVLMRPRLLSDGSTPSDTFDPNTLGRWNMIPRAYREYWSFKDRTIRLRRAPSVPEAQRLHAEIVTCLHQALPDTVRLALSELRWTVSLETDSTEEMATSSREYFDAYARLAQEPVEKIIVQLGRIARELRRKWSDHDVRNLVVPLLTPMVDPSVFADPGFVKDAVFREIQVQGKTWSWYGQIVDEVIKAACASSETSGRSVQMSEGQSETDIVQQCQED